MSEENPEQDLTEEEIEDLQKVWGYGSPEPEKKDSIFKFFREILHTKDSTKVGNLNDNEIGGAKIGIRNYQNIAIYAETEGLDVVGKYLRAKSEIVSATSMSRKGFLAQLFVTQIKKEQKVKTATDPKKSWFFNRNQVQQSQEE